jgi:hypothetical protein
MRIVSLAVLTILTAAAVSAQVEEVYSRTVRIFHPRGDLPRLLVRLTPPGGSNWKRIEGEGLPLRLTVPANALVDRTPAESRILEVKLAGSKTVPPPVLRIDRFTPGAEDPTEVDVEYADDYAAEYSKSAFNGKLTVSDSGMMTLERKTKFAMVGGTYATGAVESYRIQCAYLSKDQQLFVTFDCVSRDWPQYAEQVGQILLSLQVERRKEK